MRREVRCHPLLLILLTHGTTMHTQKITAHAHTPPGNIRGLPPFVRSAVYLMTEDAAHTPPTRHTNTHMSGQVGAPHVDGNKQRITDGGQPVLPPEAFFAEIHVGAHASHGGTRRAHVTTNIR
jgi:hypothetical protein